ncbi:hypothetical protein BXZ70DRAFT_954045 [Cristinia sonorae]|uniref:DUF7918 domain-containing protein n=1 Tax=Cristinia sonorae TaxID=1940300 RepID=A0A8K0XLJ3_9AGAR|nr:hypothetical protein BXZ70DRAFT_954045 [Cristinia sonorae]
MPQFREFGAWILVDGKELEEYDVKTDDSTITCFVPSIVGQTFTIKVKNKYGEKVSFQIMVDGTRVKGLLCCSEREEVIHGIDVTATSYRPLAFGSLNLTDDDDARDGSQWQDLGSIEVRVRRFIQGSQRDSRVKNREQNITNVAIHERSKKAGTHRVTLGEKKKRPVIKLSCVDHIDTLENPYVKIRFLYRPKDILQAQGIIPQISSPLRQSSQKRPGAELEQHGSHPRKLRTGSVKSRGSARTVKNEDDDGHPASQTIVEKEERMKAMMAEVEKMRSELEAERSQVGIKREASPIHVPPPASGKRVFIDLTDD